MNAIYFHLIGGAAGDMLLSSLIGLGCPLAHLRKEFRKLKINFGVRTFKKNVGHTSALFLDYKGEANLSYRKLASLIERSHLSKFVKEQSLLAYEQLFVLEKKIHNVKKDDLQFHHLGEIDALLEITGFFIALEYLRIKNVYVSTFPLDRPAPVTLKILSGKKITPVNFNYETITPTAAILLRNAVQEEKEFTALKSAKGFGHCSDNDYLVAYLFKEETVSAFLHDEIVKIETNIDDMNPQLFESLFDELYKAQAKEVYVENVIMKKSRPAFVLTVLCDKENFARLRDIIFSYTTTFGIRYQEYKRDKLPHSFVIKPTKFGPITFRVAHEPFKKEIPEYEECVVIARKRKISLIEVYRALHPSP